MIAANRANFMLLFSLANKVTMYITAAETSNPTRKRMIDVALRFSNAIFTSNII